MRSTALALSPCILSDESKNSMTRPFYPLHTMLLLAGAVVAASGCGGQQELIARHEAELDSVYADHRALRAELSALQDTLQFYDDIESGQFYRDRRLLVQNIEELEYEIGLCHDGGRTVETLLVDDLFQPASAELTDAGRASLRATAETLRREFAGRTLRIEGHSDSTPIGPGLAARYVSNWELSADRAAAVVRFLVDAEELPAGQVELAAFGDTRPVSRNDTAAGRTQNRRIRIAVMPR